MKHNPLQNQDVSREKALAEQYEIHTNPPLPDDVDKFGNLPYLRCAWSRCGMVFSNREQLLEHVKRSRRGDFTHRLHLRSRSVLEANPEMEFADFLERSSSVGLSTNAP